MTAENGLIRQLEASAIEAIDRSRIGLAQDTQQAVEHHQGRIKRVIPDTISTYLLSKDEEPINPEDLALLHYMQSGGNGLPSDNELAPRVEAAEKAIEIVTSADMLVLPNTDSTSRESNGYFQVGKTHVLPVGRTPILSIRGRVNVDSIQNARLDLSDIGSVHPFSLIGRDDLGLPITTEKGVGSLFRRRRADLTGESRGDERRHLPVIAGSVAVRSFAIGLGTRLPISAQGLDGESEPDDTWFFGLTTGIAEEIDPEMGQEIVEAVKNRKPGLIQLIKKGLEEPLDVALDIMLEDVGENAPYVEDVIEWFERSDVQLFHAPEELQNIRDGVVTKYAKALEKRNREILDDLRGELQS